MPVAAHRRTRSGYRFRNHHEGQRHPDQRPTRRSAWRLWSGGVPGGRFGAATWKDSSGNFWLFGGSTTSKHYLNDLWKYDPSSLNPGNYATAEGTWTTVSGTAALDQPGNYTTGTLVPGARVNAATWTDGSGNFWMFGGSGYDGVAPAISASSTICGNTTAPLGSGSRAARPTSRARTVTTALKASQLPPIYPARRHEAVTWTDTTAISGCSAEKATTPLAPPAAS